ncbi:hypothetical protein [Halomarina oriensis]|uniref:hypothetical protein n=1 Tax=Halomarina oriensis TaxID=671145 RepID=UPI0018EF2E8B|nr:hypothetical protein [Halomarina oriensis]
MTAEASGGDRETGADRPDESATDDRVEDDTTETGETRPEWDDEFLDRVADSLQFNYDLQRDERVAGRRFALYGRLEMDSHKQFFHPAISFGHQFSYEHLYVDRLPRPTVADLDSLVEVGHELAADIDHDEEHYATEFVFVVLAEELTDDVAARVRSHDDRTMLKYGYHGHYEVDLVVVVPDDQRVVDSGSPIADAFRLWNTGQESSGLLGRLKGLF